MKPVIVGLSGPELLDAEAAAIRRHRPAGAILFARNIEAPGELADLVRSLRAVLPPGAVLMVDQEGGRVARLRPPHWRAHPSAAALGAHAAAERLAWLTGALIGTDCTRAGFDVVAAPVLDVASPDGHDVIGDRAFSADPETVARLGGAFAEGLLAAGVQPVGKHAPGHGRARADSHHELPVLDRIEDRDLLPFRRLAWLPWMMTAHIRFTGEDEAPATQSAPIIGGVIRAIGFDGVLVTDDLAMAALQGSPGERVRASLAAGCDIALHCSGVLAQSEAALEAAPEMPAHTQARLAAGRALAERSRRTHDARVLQAERDALLASHG